MDLEFAGFYQGFIPQNKITGLSFPFGSCDPQDEY